MPTESGRAQIAALRADRRPFVRAMVEAATAQLTRSLSAEHSLRAQDRLRRAPKVYDPNDVVPHHRDPSVLVSDAGLDRGPMELLRHLELELEGTRTTRYDHADAQPHLRNTVQNPLDAYYRRSLLAPEDAQLNKAYWRTGRQLRADWDTAGYRPRVVARTYDGDPSRRGDPALMEPRLDAAERVATALRAVPEVPRTCAVAVCCADEWASDWAKRRPWPKPEAAIHYLRMALDVLRAWYQRGA